MDGWMDGWRGTGGVASFVFLKEPWTKYKRRQQLHTPTKPDPDTHNHPNTTPKRPRPAPPRPAPTPQCFNAVMWLDVLSAKARCGMWLDGVLPEFTPWPSVFHARTGAARRRRLAQRQSGGAVDDDEEEAEGAAEERLAGGGDAGEDEEGEFGGAMDSGGEEGVGGPVVRLKGLSHPLLLADYLKDRERLQRQLRLMGADAGVGIGGQQQAKRPGQRQGGAEQQQKKRRSFLSNRKDSMMLGRWGILYPSEGFGLALSFNPKCLNTKWTCQPNRPCPPPHPTPTLTPTPTLPQPQPQPPAAHPTASQRKTRRRPRSRRCSRSWPPSKRPGPWTSSSRLRRAWWSSRGRTPVRARARGSSGVVGWLGGVGRGGSR